MQNGVLATLCERARPRGRIVEVADPRVECTISVRVVGWVV